MTIFQNAQQTMPGIAPNIPLNCFKPSLPMCSIMTWCGAKAEESGLADHSVDAITVGQALHWFDVDRFYAEAHRVLKPGAGLAAVEPFFQQIADRCGEPDLKRMMVTKLFVRMGTTNR